MRKSNFKVSQDNGITVLTVETEESMPGSADETTTGSFTARMLKDNTSDLICALEQDERQTIELAGGARIQIYKDGPDSTYHVLEVHTGDGKYDRVSCEHDGQHAKLVLDLRTAIDQIPPQAKRRKVERIVGLAPAGYNPEQEAQRIKNEELKDAARDKGYSEFLDLLESEVEKLGNKEIRLERQLHGARLHGIGSRCTIRPEHFAPEPWAAEAGIAFNYENGVRIEYVPQITSAGAWRKWVNHSREGKDIQSANIVQDLILKAQHASLIS